MALTEPFDFLADWPGWTTRFEIQARQEQSRDAGGQTFVKDLGPPLWRMAAQTKALRPNMVDYWRARLDALENGLMTFYGYSLSRCYPILYPNGSWPTGATFPGTNAAVHTVGSNNKSLRLKALPPGFQLSVGDMIQIRDADLHRVMELTTADGAGVTGFFEVRPHLWPGVAADNVVSVKRPHCLMSVIPGSIQTQTDLSGWGTVSFEAMEAR